MRKKEKISEDKALNQITKIGTISIIIMLFVFLFISLVATNNLIRQIHVLTEHPFVVNSNLSNIKTELALMRVNTERLQSYNQPTDVDIVKDKLAELYISMEELLAETNELYLGSKADTQELISIFQSIKVAHQDFLEFSVLETSTTRVITDYEIKNLYPLYDKFEKHIDSVIANVRNTEHKILMSANTMSRNTTIGLIFNISIVVIALIAFQRTIWRISKKLVNNKQQFEMLSNTIDETFLIFDKNKTTCEFVSNNAYKMLGVTSEQLFYNRKVLYDYIKDDNVAEIQNYMENGNGVAFNKVIEYQNPNQALPLFLYLQFYHTDANKYIVTINDRSEEIRANETIKDALVNAQKANNAKKDFLSKMSHEIRTPMNAIIGMTMIAASSIGNQAKVEDCLEKISYSSKHLLMLINDILDMSRIENNKISLHYEPFDMYQFINGLVSVVYPQATYKNIEFSEKINGFDTKTTFLGDTLRLNQVLLNVISNAIKFTPDGGKVDFEITLLHNRGRKNWIRFEISDTGIGMDEEGLKSLYVPFEQANTTIASKYGGTGLGMPITLNLVSLMGGHINVKSELGIGSTFTIEIPFDSSDVELQVLRDTDLEALEVLVVDDEKDICEHTVLLLEKMKINAEWALSGAEAIEKVINAMKNKQGYDVCFIDWKMPNMDGVETTREIRKIVGPTTPIIVITAYDWTDIEQEAREAGVNAFIAKPVFSSSIYNVLVSVTNERFGRVNNNKIVRSKSLKGIRILLAEDNSLNTEIVVSLLEMNEATVEAVENGQEAYERFLRMEPNYYDVILMDVQMPIMDGCEATRQIRNCGREDGKTIPIIATTANAFAEDIASVIDAGMNAHISKPLNIEQLYKLIEELCD